MPDEPISDPGIPPTPRTTPPSREQPGLGSGEEAQEPKPFSLPPTAPKEAPKGAPIEGKPTPMEAAQEGGGVKTSRELVLEQAKQLQDKIQKTQQLYTDPSKTQGLTQDHYDAMLKTTDRLSVDMQKVGKYTNSEFEPPQKTKGETVLQYITKYLNSSQGTMQKATEFLANVKKPNMAQFLSVQYAMQRSSQKIELLAGIIGASVSGVKTLMSTQLG